MTPRETLENLRRTDDGTPAARLVNDGEVCTIWEVSPGNGTAYTVVWRKVAVLAIAQVGADRSQPNAMAEPGRAATTAGKWRHPQDREICLYLASIAAGNETPLPHWLEPRPNPAGQ